MQHAISYVIARLAKIADIDSTNVESSLMERVVRISDMALRRDTLNTLLPIPIDSGHVNHLRVEIPWPTSSQPLKLCLLDTTLVLNRNLTYCENEMSLEEIRSNITEETILGPLAEEETWMTEWDGANVDSQVPSGEPLLEKYTPALEISQTVSEVDDDDYLSCRSGEDVSLNSSFSGRPEDTVLTPRDTGTGVISFLYNAAAQSISWIMRRSIEVEMENVTIMLPCNSERTSSIEVKVQKLMVHIEPMKDSGAESMRITSLNFSGVTVSAQSIELSKNVVTVDSFGVRMTSVFSSNDRLCRNNKVIEIDSASSVFMDEETLQTLASCIISHENMTNIPKYCKPFFSLRSQKSWWSYAKNCVLAEIRDRKKRFNFNPSHLHFYAEARNTYIRLLDYSLRTKDVSEKRGNLAEVEKDLRYRDVVMFLRAHVQGKYMSNSTAIGTFQPKPTNQVQGADSLAASSLHVDVKMLRLCLSASTVVSIRDISFVSRFEEKQFSVGSLTIDSEGILQKLCGPCESEMLFFVEVTEKNNMLLIKVKVEEVRLALQSPLLLRIAQPFAEMILSVLPRLLSLSDKSAAPSSTVSARLSRTISLVFPLVCISIDDCIFTTEKLSLTYIERDGHRGRWGTLLKEFSVRMTNHEEVISPINIVMANNDDIICSKVSVHISNALWDYFCRVRHEWENVIAIFQKINMTVGTENNSNEPLNGGRVAEKDVSLPTFDEIGKLSLMKHVSEGSSKHQRMCLAGITCNFCPIRGKIEIRSIDVSKATCANQQGAIRVGVSLFHLSIDFIDGVTFTATLPRGVYCLLPLSADRTSGKAIISVDSFDLMWTTSISTTMIATKRTETFALVKGSNGKLVICDDTMYCLSDNVVVLDAIQVAPLKIMYRSHCVGIPTTFRPYLASFMQVYVNLARVYVESLAHVSLEPLMSSFNHWGALLVEKVVSQVSYRLFFSGLSDLALVVTAIPCELDVGEAGGTISLQVRTPSEPGKETLSEYFGVLLPEMREYEPLLVQNICETLTIKIKLPILQLEAFHSSFSGIRFRILIRAIASTVPMGTQEFWEPAVRSIQKSVQHAAIQNVTFSLNDDLTTLEFISLQFNQRATNVPCRESSSSVCGGSGGCGCSVSGSIENDVGSDVSSVFPVEETIQLEVSAWNLRFQAAPDAALVQDLMMLYSELCFMFDSIAKRRLIVSDSVIHQSFMLDQTGPCFFDRPGGVILVEDCSFLCATSGNLRLVVCRETCVYFRGCRFSASLQDAICTEDSSAFFVIEENCSEVERIAHNDTKPLSLAEVERRPSHWICLNLQRGNVYVALGGKRSYGARLSLPSIDVHVRSASHKNIAQLRIQRICCDMIEEGVISHLFTRTDVDIDTRVDMEKKHAMLNAAFQVNSVTVPLSLLEVTRSIQNKYNEVFLREKTTCRRFYTLPAAPGEPCRFLFVKWKVVVSFSVVPIELRLLNGIPFVKLMIPNTAIWSKRASTGEAFLEARVGLQEFGIWEFSSQAHVPLLRKPLSAVLVIRTKDFTSLSCDISLSSCELSVSSEQMRCALSICNAFQSETDMMLRLEKDSKLASSVNLFNLTGAPLLIRTSTTEEIELRNHLFLHRKTLSLPHCLHKINEQSVVHVENSSYPFPNNPQQEILLHTAHTAVLEDGDRVHMVTQVKEGSLMQIVTFRSIFHIMNTLSCCIEFYSKRENNLVVVAMPGELCCIPLAYMDAEDIVMCLKDTDTNAHSQYELLGEGSPRSLLRAVQCCGEDNIGRLKTFVFEGSEKTSYVDVAYRLVDSIVTMMLAPATPVIRNGTRFPLRVFLFLDGELTDEKTLNPNEVLKGISYDPFGLPLQFSFGCVVHGETFFSDEKMDLKSIDSRASGSLVMKHFNYPRRYFFELNIERDSSQLLVPHLFYSVRPLYVFGLENNTSFGVDFISEDGNSAGSLSGKVLASSPDRNFAYLPFNTFMILQIGTFRSAPFEVRENNSEGRLIVCDVNTSTGNMGNSHCFILRPIESGGDGNNMELVPAVFFFNKCKSRNLLVKHTVQLKDIANGVCSTEKDEWIHNAVVLANDILPYTVLSRFGYTDFLSFAWECDNSDEVAYSVPVEVKVSSKMDWTGFIQCGKTHHALYIRREGSVDPVIIIVGPPRQPYVRLVNLTPRAFDNLPSMTVLSYTPPSVNNDEVVLSLAEEELRISLNQDTSMALGDRMSVFVQSSRDAVTIVLVHVPLEETSFSQIQELHRVVPQKSFNAESVSSSLMSSWRIDFKFSELLFVVRDAGESPIYLSVETGELWLACQSSKITAQYTMSNVCLQSTYAGKRSYIVKPFCVDFGIRDLEWTDNVVHIQSAQINLTCLVLEVSDVFLYQLQQLHKRCEVPVTNKKGTPFMIMNKISAPMWRHRRVELASSGISEVSIVLTWDRSVTPPEDVVFRGSPIGSLVPSLRCATMKLPTLKFRDISGNSALEVLHIVQRVLTIEFFKQTPKLLTSVVLFPSLPPLGSVLSRVGSFIFGTRSYSSDLTGTTLI